MPARHESAGARSAIDHTALAIGLAPDPPASVSVPMELRRLSDLVAVAETLNRSQVARGRV